MAVKEKGMGKAQSGWTQVLSGTTWRPDLSELERPDAHWIPRKATDVSAGFERRNAYATVCALWLLAWEG